jgi:GNAT superfamily N-acetyltransferase
VARHVIRELAENPNVHQRPSPGRELHLDPRGRFAVYLMPGTAPDAATVQRVRLDPGTVEQTLAEVRALLRELGREGAEWELGESSTPPGLVEELLALGLRRIEADPVTIGMALQGRPSWETPAGVAARRVTDVDELVRAREVQHVAFGDTRRVDRQRAADDFEREGIDGSTFLAWVDGEPAAAGYAAYTPHGLILFGGATLPEARGRGAYRALVAARADEATDRGTPLLVTHAGQMSRPILERLGFVPVARIDRLIDVL